MPLIPIGDRTVEVDKLGFIVNPKEWDTEVAETLAKNHSLGPLLEEHWRVITYIREYYEKCETAPMLRAISKRTGLNEKRLKELFPISCRECMCLVAGLSQPTG